MRWGELLRAADVASALTPESPESRILREVLHRYALSALRDRVVVGALDADFRAWLSAGDSSHGQLVRLLSVLEALITEDLPRLRRAVRCEAAIAREALPLPAGGRVDWLATTRREPAVHVTSAPRAWAVQRVLRQGQTPVNTLLATMLHDVAGRIRSALRLAPAWRLRRSEDDCLRWASRALDDFMVSTPLGRVVPFEGASPSVLERRVARHRRELTRVMPFVRRWRDLHDVDLTALRHASRPSEELDVATCFDLTVALSLLLAASEGRRAIGGGPGLRFSGREDELSVEIAARPVATIGAVPVTAALTLRRGQRTREVIVLTCAGSRREIATALDRLDLLSQLSGAEGILVTPSGPEEVFSHDRLQHRCLADLRAPAVDFVGGWAAYLQS